MAQFIYVIFSLCYLYISNWNRVHTFAKTFPSKKVKDKNIQKVADKKLADLIYKRTGVKISHIYLVPSKKLFAYSGGIYKKPLLFISTAAHKTFTGDALEWLILHELAHSLYFHPFAIAAVQLFYLGIGIYLLSMIYVLPILTLVTLPLSIALGIASIQTNKEFDWLANAYAAEHMKNPKGMKEGALLLMKQAQDRGVYADTLVMKLFYPWNYTLWQETIQAAEKEIARRHRIIFREKH